MYLKVTPIVMFIISAILTIFALSYLGIGDAYTYAPPFWLFYLIWSITFASIISFFVMRKIIKSTYSLLTTLSHFLLSLVVALILIAFIPNSFVSYIGNYNNQIMFRTLPHTLSAPVLTVTIHEGDLNNKSHKIYQVIHYWGFIGYTTSPNYTDNQYQGIVKDDPTTLEYALATNSPSDFTNKFIAILDSRIDSRINRNIKSLSINPSDIAPEIMQKLPQSKTLDTLDIIIAFKEISLLDKISGFDGNEKKWSIGALFIDLEGRQFYDYFRQAKDEKKVRFVDSRYDSWSYGADYFYWSTVFLDTDLAKDLIAKKYKPAPIYLILTITKINTSTLETDQLHSAVELINVFTRSVNFDEFSQKATGKRDLEFSDKTNVGYAAKSNGQDISDIYNNQLNLLNKKYPEIYQILINNGYRLIVDPEMTTPQ